MNPWGRDKDMMRIQSILQVHKPPFLPNPVHTQTKYPTQQDEYQQFLKKSHGVGLPWVLPMLSHTPIPFIFSIYPH